MLTKYKKFDKISTMIVKFNCFCGQPIEVENSTGGEFIYCPSCQSELMIPLRMPSSFVLPDSISSPKIINLSNHNRQTIDNLPGEEIIMLRIIGIVISVIGIITLLNYFNMDTSVPGEDGNRIFNIGLISVRQNGVVLGAGIMIVGVMMALKNKP
jgi:hypothetical protein